MKNSDSVTNQITETIRDYILRKNLTPGSKLPSENELSEQLHVSRASIREAMKTLESSGLVVSMQGKGRYINDFDYAKLVENFNYSFKVNFTEFKEVVQIRKALESYFLPCISSDLTDDDYSDLNKLIDIMEKQIENGKTFNDISLTHSKFHKRLYSKLNNKILESLIVMFTVFQQTRGTKPQADADFINEHRNLLACLKNGDKHLIYETISRHFESYDNL